MNKFDTVIRSNLNDWHPADIKAALEKAGWSFRRLSKANGYSAGALVNCLRNPWPRAEAIVAAAIGLTAPEIWPSRYHPDGSPKSGRGERGIGRIKKKDTTGPEHRNVCDRETD